MNSQRRKAIAAVASALDDLRTQLEELRDDETTALEALPDSLQETERAERMREAVDLLDTAVTDMETIVANLEEATQ